MGVQLQSSEKLSLVSHKGKKIYYTNYSGMGGDEMLALLEEDEKFRKNRGGEIKLILIDTTNATITRSCLAKIKENMTIELPNLGKSAIVGVTGVKKALLATANRFGSGNLKPFSNLDEAKDWLVSK